MFGENLPPDCQCNYRETDCASSLTDSLNIWRGSRENVSQIYEDGAIVRISGLIGSHEPWDTKIVRILKHELQGTPVRVPPERPDQAACPFLYVPVLDIGGAGVAIPNQLSVQVDCRIPVEVICAVI